MTAALIVDAGTRGSLVAINGVPPLASCASTVGLIILTSEPILMHASYRNKFRHVSLLGVNITITVDDPGTPRTTKRWYFFHSIFLAPCPYPLLALV